MIETQEITEPKRDSLYWAKYWLKVKTKLNCNNFDEQVKELREKIRKDLEKAQLFYAIHYHEREDTKENREKLKVCNDFQIKCKEIISICDAILGNQEVLVIPEEELIKRKNVYTLGLDEKEKGVVKK